MTAAPAPAEAQPTTSTPDELVHFWCCQPLIAICGTTRDHNDDDPDGADDVTVDCAVCLELARGSAPCNLCGATG